jgi:glyoxylase-like metal-dependent hydrolase (beta-lactamase superfamily II)
VTLHETPGHTPQDITTLVETDAGVAALTHLWWFEGIEGDPRATDEPRLLAERERVLEVASLIVPGHGPAFSV